MSEVTVEVTDGYLATLQQRLDAAEEGSGDGGLLPLYVRVGPEQSGSPVLPCLSVTEGGEVVHTADEAGQPLVVESPVLPP